MENPNYRILINYEELLKTNNPQSTCKKWIDNIIFI